MNNKPNLFHDNYQNFKGYHIPKAQFVIADIPYNIGINAYGSNPSWYEGGDRKNGESALAGKKFFRSDDNFNSHEFMHFASKLLKKEPRDRGQAPCMLVFCSFEQQYGLIELAKEFGFANCIPMMFRKNYSAQVLKANMRPVGNVEYGLLFYRNKLMKFNNNRKMVFTVQDWIKDDAKSPLYRKLHPTQKPVALLQHLIEIFTDEGDVVIDPTAGSGSTLIAAENLDRRAYGFEVDRETHRKANEWVQFNRKCREENAAMGLSPSSLKRQTSTPTLWDGITS